MKVLSGYSCSEFQLITGVGVFYLLTDLFVISVKSQK